MGNRVPTLVAAGLLGVSIMSFANVASAMPVADALAIKNAAPTDVETVQWRGRGWGWGAGAAFVGGGAIIAGAPAAPYYADYGYYTYPDPGPSGTYRWRWRYGPHYYYKWYHNPWYYRDW
jgi:MFS family permease